MLLEQIAVQVDFFNKRDGYRIQLRKAMRKYGVANLPVSVQQTIPADTKVLYELSWKLQPKVWIRILQIAYLNAERKVVEEVLNEREN